MWDIRDLRRLVSVSDAPTLAGIASALVGLELTGARLLGLSGVNRVFPGLPLTRPGGSLSLIALGVSLILVAHRESRASLRLGRTLALVVAALGVVALLEYPLGSLGLARLRLGDSSPAHGRVAPEAVASAVLLGAALVTISSVRWPRAGSWMLGAAGAVVVVALVGVAFDVRFFSSGGVSTGIGIQGLLGLALAVTGAVFLRPAEGIVGYLRRDDLGAAMARHVLPVAALGPILFGLAHRAVEGLGLSRAVAVELTTLGGVCGSFALVMIVARRLTASDAARRIAEGQFLQAFHESPFGMALTALDGRILEANASICALIGYEPGELVGLNFATFVHPDDVGRDLEARRALIAGEARPYRAEKRYMSAKHELLDVEVSVTLVRDARGAPSHFISQVVDMSDRRRLEQQLLQAKKLEAIGQLANGIAHDFNNLLTVVDGYASLALKQLDGEASFSRRALGEIVSASRSAAALTAKLLSFSRTQASHTTIVPLNEVVGEALDLVAPLIGANISVERKLGDDVACVEVDKAELEQVVVNLAINARDAMETGGHLSVETGLVELEPEAVLGQEPGTYVQVDIRDDGCGMDEETLTRIFEPFFTTKPVGKGTGLGLSSAYGAIRQSGGQIAVESELGKGTTFTIYLPHVERRGALLLDPDILPAATGELGRILLVEDEESVRGLMREMLVSAGLDVVEAGHAEEALVLLAQGPFDLMVTDTVMPGDDGTTLARAAARLQPGLPILFVSGYRPRSAGNITVEGSETAFLGKPFGPEELNGEVQRMLRSTRGSTSMPAPAVAVAERRAREQEAPALRVALEPRPELRPPETEAITVLICDDTEAIRMVLRDALESEPALSVIGEASDGVQAISEAACLQPDVILLDLSMPVFSGLEAIPELRRVAPQSRIVAFSGSSAAQEGSEALARGAHAFVEKGSAISAILEALKARD